MSKWSVSIQAEGDRPVELSEVVALADAVAPLGGIASGVGAMAYGAQIVIEAENADIAVETAMEAFAAAVETANLPAWPMTRAEVIGEDEFEVGDSGFDE
ncbi:hypothetical protein [Candidatus Poriferisodalis sp.]|uniref:hypothetical protein n=1 Tax=Candidatus Poriferisodalis sp. TaxID=3101277 RepID=UPI003B58DB9A